MIANKLKLILLALVLTGLSFCVNVFAGTLRLEGDNAKIKVGQEYDVIVRLDPAGAMVYTTQAVVKFAPNILEIKSFAYNDGWLALNQAGYSLVDNATGNFIKTAGFPAGLNESAGFVRIKFMAKSAGLATIAIDSKSLVWDKEAKNLLTPVNESLSFEVMPNNDLVASVNSSATGPVQEMSFFKKLFTISLITEEKPASVALFDIAIMPISLKNGFGSIGLMTLIAYILAAFFVILFVRYLIIKKRLRQIAKETIIH